MKHDIVYLLKNDYNSQELKYSIRSVVQNFPYRKIVFVGGKPEDIDPDIYLPDSQPGQTKWQKSTHSLRLACKCDDLTPDIWLFNDDFFVMDKVKSDVNYFGGTLERRIRELRRLHPGGSAYTRSLELMKSNLVKSDCDTLDFCLHLPMLVNREKVLKLFKDRPDCIMFRSFYGNVYEIDCQYSKDCKVYDLESIPDTPYISTTDESFKGGKVGEFLRQYFDTPSKYEKSGEEKSKNE